MATDELDDYAEQMRAVPEGWVNAMGIELLKATEEEVVAEWTVGSHHLQGYGIVHGGVHCGVVETLCSVGAAVYAFRSGQSVVGLENQTSFLRAVRSGRLRAVARPLQRGRKTQVWQADITDEEQRLVATGRVRLICLDPTTPLAGRPSGAPEDQAARP